MTDPTKKLGIIHCTDTPPGMDIGEAEITPWHTDAPPKGNGWSANGYAKIFRRDGTVENARDLDNDGDVYDEIGAHARGFNRNSIGLCLVGGHKGKFDFTDKQLDALWVEMDEVEKRFPDIEWCGHCDVDSRKSCPNFNVKTWRYGDAKK